MPGFGSALSSICCPAIATALVPLVTILLVAALTGVSPQRGGRPGLMPVLGAVFFGHMPDRLGGAKFALICVLIEAAGLALIWLASGLILAAVGSALAGFGYSLVYPGLGVEAVRRAPPQSRGLAIGAYTVFLDVALGFRQPRLGFDRELGWSEFGVSRHHVHGAWHSDRCGAATQARR